jgi:hypothetical protein
MRTAAALLVLLAVAVGLYWKLTLSDRYTWLENPDQALQARPWFEYEAREWHAGRVPLWAADELAGQTLIGEVQPGVVNPINWLLFAMPLRDGHIQLRFLHWWWVLIHWAAAVFCFLLCRDLKCGWAASLVGACVFAFIGYIGWAGTPYFLTSSLWFPLVMLFLARVFRGERPVANAVLCGAALGASFLGGHHNVPIYSAVIVAAVWVWILARQWSPRGDAARYFTAAALCALTCILVSAVQALPAIEYGREALRWSGAPDPQRWGDRIPYSIHTEYSLKARSLPGMLVPGLAVHANSYIGVTALGLALVAIFCRARRRPAQSAVATSDTRLFTFVAVFGLLLALGNDTPVQWLAYRLIPLVDKARYPAMAIVLSQLGIAALVAQALSLPAATLRKAALPFAITGISGLALYFALDHFHRVPVGHPAWVVAAVALALAAVLRWFHASPIAVLALFLIEAAIYPAPIIREREFPGSYASLIESQSDIAAFLKAQPGWFRVDFDEDVVPYNFGNLYGIEQFNGYLASMTVRFNRALGQPSTPRLYGVQYRVAKAPSNPAQVEVFQSRSGLKVYRDPRIGEPLWVYRDQPCAAPDRLRVVSRVPNASVFEVDLGCPGLVVTGDPWYRGWRAWVDGVRVPVQEFEAGTRAVRAAAGKHRIEYRYRPFSVYLGAILTLIGLFFALFARVYQHIGSTPAVATGSSPR